MAPSLTTWSEIFCFRSQQSPARDKGQGSSKRIGCLTSGLDLVQSSHGEQTGVPLPALREAPQADKRGDQKL